MILFPTIIIYDKFVDFILFFIGNVCRKHYENAYSSPVLRTSFLTFCYFKFIRIEHKKIH